MHKGLGRQVGKTFFQEGFALGAGIDDQLRSPDGHGYFDFAPDGIHESFVGERPHDSGSTDDGDAVNDPELGIEGALGQFAAAGYGNRDIEAAVVQGRQFLFDHLARNAIDSRAPDRQAQARQRYTAYAFALQELDAGFVAEGDGDYNGLSIGNIGIVTGVFDDGSGSLIRKKLRPSNARQNLFWPSEGAWAKKNLPLHQACPSRSFLRMRLQMDVSNG